MRKAISVSTTPIFMIFFSPNGRYLRDFSRSCLVFQIPQGTLPWQPILCRRAFSFGTEVSEDLLHRYSQSLHYMVNTELQMINATFFFRYLKGDCHGNQFCGKITYPLHLPIWHSDMEWDLATSMCVLTAYMMTLMLSFGEEIAKITKIGPVDPKIIVLRAISKKRKKEKN